MRIRLNRRLLDVLLIPFLVPAAVLMRQVRTIGIARLPLCRWMLRRLGVFPIRNHYFEPLFDDRRLHSPLNAIRSLPGIDWNVEEQLDLLRQMHFGDELTDVPRSKPKELEFYIDNGSFGINDAEFLYNMVRLKKPKRFIEIGSGNSTLIVRRAILKNSFEDSSYVCEHICIEPYEAPWLERLGIGVVRKRVEELPEAYFSVLEQDDFLFIDSSHVIRPQGDVLFEYLQILPSLRGGVIVHIHDIFSPRDYLRNIIVNEIKFWNEQYLLEAFLTCNPDFKVIGALNMLHHAHYEQLSATCLSLSPDSEPGSFYIQRRT